MVVVMVVAMAAEMAAVVMQALGERRVQVAVLPVLVVGYPAQVRVRRKQVKAVVVAARGQGIPARMPVNLPY